MRFALPICQGQGVRGMSALTVILLHGLMCDRTVWAHQRAALAVDNDVMIPDLRDFDSLEAMARSVLALAPPRFHLVGHSMGGRVAWEVIRMAPDRVDSLVVLDTGIHPLAEDEPAMRQRLVDLADSSGMEAVAEVWLPPMLHPDRRGDRELMQPLVAMVSGYGVDQFKGQIRALLGRHDANPVLPTISCPTLVVCGRQDGFSPLVRHEDFAALIPGAELAVVEDAGHMVTVEQPEAVTDLLVEWVSRVEGGRPGDASANGEVAE